MQILRKTTIAVGSGIIVIGGISTYFICLTSTDMSQLMAEAQISWEAQISIGIGLAISITMLAIGINIYIRKT